MGTPDPQAVLGEVATHFSGVEDKGAIEKDGSTAFRNRNEAGNFATGSAFGMALFVLIPRTQSGRVLTFAFPLRNYEVKVVIVRPKLLFCEVIRWQSVCDVIIARGSCTVLRPHDFFERSRSGFRRTPRSDGSFMTDLWA